MKNVHLLLVFVLVGLLSVTAQAEVTPTGFQGIFGDIDVSPLTLTAGLTSGATINSGISATFDDLVINLAGYTINGDPVSVSDLVLTGSNGATGSATYSWDMAALLQVTSVPEHSTGAGVLTGQLTLEPGSDLTTTSSEAVILPEMIDVTITYNGLVVASDGSNGYGTAFSFPSASITAVQVPEPATIVGLIAGLGTMLLIWRRRK